MLLLWEADQSYESRGNPQTSMAQGCHLQGKSFMNYIHCALCKPFLGKLLHYYLLVTAKNLNTYSSLVRIKSTALPKSQNFCR